MSVTRLVINSKEFYKNPKQSIMMLLGNDIELINYIQSDIVLNDGEVIIDVFYKKLSLNPFTIYFVKQEDMKALTPTGGTFVTKIDDIPVKIKTTNVEDILPIRILPTSDDPMFKYFAQIVRNPLTHFQTNMKYPNYIYLESSFLPIKLYPDSFKININEKDLNTSKYPNAKLLSKIPEDLTHGILISPNNIPPPYFLYENSPTILIPQDINLFQHYLQIETINNLNYYFMSPKTK
jgi:hypothetical protein